MKYPGQRFIVAVPIQVKRTPRERITERMLTEPLRVHPALNQDTLEPIETGAL
jgi:hypothetical protein